MNATYHDFARRRDNTLMKRTALFALLGTLLAASPDPSWAGDRKNGNRRGKTIPFSEAQVKIELNATDGDAGLHIFLDARAWKSVKILDPRWELIFEVEGGGSVRKTGLTELFFESAEPGFDDLPLDEFLERFPAGEYRFYGETLEGEVLFSKATLTHALPDAPVLLSPAEDSVQDPNNTVVAWEPVGNPRGSRIVRYEVIVEDEGATPERVFSAVVPATVTSITVPSAFLLAGNEYKYEVLAIEEGGNQTISEAPFRTAP